MKLSVSAFANTFGALGAIYFIGCFVVASLLPDVYKSVAESWMHMLSLNGLWKNAPGDFLLGLISFTMVSWITGWLFAWLYNRLAK